MLGRIQVWFLTAAAAAVGFPGSHTASAGTVAPRTASPHASPFAEDPHSSKTALFDEPILFSVNAGHNDASLEGVVPLDSGNGVQAGASHRLVIPPLSDTGLALAGAEYSAEGVHPADVDAPHFPFAEADSSIDPSPLSSVSVEAADPLHVDTESTVVGADAARGTASPVVIRRPLAIPLPPAAALFPLGVAAAIWARRWFRG